MNERGSLIAIKLIAIFGIVGLGLGAGSLIFLWAVGFFNRTGGLEDLGAAFAGGIAIAGVLVFALLIGIVLATIGGLWAGGSVISRSQAVVASAIGAGIGHVVLIGVLGVFLIVGLGVGSSATPETPEPSPSPLDQECIELFGPIPLCGGQTEIPEEPEGEEVSVQQFLKLALGLVPAALVGALTAAVGFSRRELKTAQAP